MTTDIRFDRIDKRFDRIDKRFDGIDIRLDALDRKMDGIENELHRQGILAEARDVKIDQIMEMMIAQNEREERRISLEPFIRDHEFRTGCLEGSCF